MEDGDIRPAPFADKLAHDDACQNGVIAYDENGIGFADSKRQMRPASVARSRWLAAERSNTRKRRNHRD